MNQEQRQAYEWAKNQDYQSVAARYAKILAGLINEMNAPSVVRCSHDGRGRGDGDGEDGDA